MGPSDRARVARDRLAPLRDREGRAARPEDLGQGIYLGRVYNGGSMPTVAGRYVLTRPLSLSGDETEGLAHSGAADVARSVPVLLLGSPPAVGDDLLARLVDGRWVAEKRGASSGGPGGPVNIGGCLCQGTPLNLFLTVTFPENESGATYGNAYRDCTLQYYNQAPPSYLPRSAYPGPAYYSVNSWVDDYGFTDYLTLSCYSTQYALGIGQYGGGTWQAPGQIYLWSVGGRDAVNFCSPFLLARGQATPGFNFNGRFRVQQ